MLMGPVLLTLLLGVIDFTWCLMTWRTVISSAQVGTRAGAKVPLSENPTQTAIRVATAALESTWLTGEGQLNADYTSTIVGAENNILRLEVTAEFTPIIGFVATPERLWGMQQMRVELE